MNVCITPKSTTEFDKYYQLRWQVLRQSWHQALGSEQDELEARSYHRMIVDENQQVLAVGRLEKSSQHLAKIRYMAVNPEMQGKGLGQQIIDELEQLAQQLGVTEIELNARENALGFYLKLGYQEQGFSHLLFDEIKHFVMRKCLSPNNKHQIVNTQALQALWYKTIPMSQAMGIEISYYDGETLLSHCDACFNQNLHHTMFAGSIYTLATLSGWAWVYLQLNEANLEGDIVLAEGNVRYHAPIEGVAHAKVDHEYTHQEFIPLQQSNKARIKLNVQVYCGDNVAATFNGTYFVIPKK
tara:strand:- start:105 stop:998 length:894 start_codon:yes stop_codon:yes gene_type:complete